MSIMQTRQTHKNQSHFRFEQHLNTIYAQFYSSIFILERLVFKYGKVNTVTQWIWRKRTTNKQYPGYSEKNCTYQIQHHMTGSSTKWKEYFFDCAKETCKWLPEDHQGKRFWKMLQDMEQKNVKMHGLHKGLF